LPLHLSAGCSSPCRNPSSQGSLEWPTWPFRSGCLLAFLSYAQGKLILLTLTHLLRSCFFWALKYGRTGPMATLVCLWGQIGTL
jgi:hypothetical protein